MAVKTISLTVSEYLTTIMLNGTFASTHASQASLIEQAGSPSPTMQEHAWPTPLKLDIPIFRAIIATLKGETDETFNSSTD